MKILIASCVRQKPNIFREFLEGLSDLDVSDLAITFGFIFHNWTEGEKILSDFSLPGQLAVAHYTSQNEYITDSESHHWNHQLVNDLIYMKNNLLQTCISGGFDFILFVDSDLYLHPATLKVLLSRNKDVISEVFWTKWKPAESEMPNSWDYDHYSLLDDSISLWKHPGVYKVGGTGACILISAKAIISGLSYSRIYNISWWGEDRYFQLHAATRGITMWMDTTCPAYHIYRETDLLNLQIWKSQSFRLPMENVRKTSANRICAMMVVRNESGRYLEAILDSIYENVDEIAIVDDCSDDNTIEICKRYSKSRILKLKQSFFGQESELRSTAWTWALEGHPDWILSLDADVLFENTSMLETLVNQDSIDVWAFRMFDMWNETHYREDQLWNLHLRPTPMLLRVFHNFPYKWDGRDHHSSRLPSNLSQFSFGVSDIRVKHLGWMRENDRIKKYDRYMKYDSEGKWGSVKQYESILDVNPNLKPY